MAPGHALVSRLKRFYPDALSVKEVSGILNLSTKTVYKLLTGGVIPSGKVSKSRWIAKSQLIEFLNRNEEPVAPQALTFLSAGHGKEKEYGK